ncbi:N-acetylmannosamine-6-phosphate 2-epimerase [Candidatus Synechococcus calcipolaris G9]|uniref:Putative N-acetylmannosamine-6-phosphate 2-epimerase n=1 Tax=Candidatus Synechococcus calcipolaris G9 TaxID=1497997 RepID=A0ABT6F029_9SYNE|nr:N-acetylmannosamine-6-phosphate 2-epimerase [Candidatus Synechococcus calcipolaris]MDG2991218.1 N-acetylmannosamine-6-phosphate 2-epimerase [Candidatus Synechococcus calcipolaris G9]
MNQNLTAKFFPQLRGGLIVSCQAPPESPLAEPNIIAAMAIAAIGQGAVGVRINTPAHIQAVRQQRHQSNQTHLPIIGLWKQVLADYPVYITPRFGDAAAVALAGADIIAIDATLRSRPEPLKSLIERIHTELEKPVMADIDTLGAAEEAVAAGADCVGTTLYGYTAETQTYAPPGWELLETLVQTLKVPVLCEGGISSPQMARKALDLGAFAVVVGTDITGIDLKVQAYCRAIAPSSTGDSQ